MQLTFTKMNGLGNDFIMIDDRDESIDMTPEAVAWFCDRHFGIGGDGLILIRPATTPDADYYMHYFNADGSLAEMCGNGARCFAKYVVDQGFVAADATSLVIETLGGLRPVIFTRDDDGQLLSATVDMGIPTFAPEDIPGDFDGTQVYDCPLETPFGTFGITGVSMGNPHAIIWVDDVADAPVETVGPYIATHERFPQGTNVEFAQLVEDSTSIRMRVWERGVGETLACGTGACAVLVAGTLSCRVGRDATIELPGGDLKIRWHEDDHVYMTGSAAVSFIGTVELLEDEDA
ncbi:MAG: diaminopimelate epimerase [Coriobacteriia bacterium]|nr:diaminopimelate epimerase [Coriobacteriia bacterium]